MMHGIQGYHYMQSGEFCELGSLNLFKIAIYCYCIDTKLSRIKRFLEEDYE